jgi:dihydrofolate reductase
MNSIRKYVVSDSLGESDLTWENSVRIPRSEAVAELRELREGDEGGLLVMGSPTLARTLIAEGLVDELRLIVMPVVLGGGKSIFPDGGGKFPFELVSTTKSDAGTLVNVYRRAAG